MHGLRDIVVLDLKKFSEMSNEKVGDSAYGGTFILVTEQIGHTARGQNIIFDSADVNAGVLLQLADNGEGSDCPGMIHLQQLSQKEICVNGEARLMIPKDPLVVPDLILGFPGDKYFIIRIQFICVNDFPPQGVRGIRLYEKHCLVQQRLRCDILEVQIMKGKSQIYFLDLQHFIQMMGIVGGDLQGKVVPALCPEGDIEGEQYGSVEGICAAHGQTAFPPAVADLPHSVP